MVTPQQLQITIDCDDEEVIRRLKLAIESDHKKNWLGGDSYVIFPLQEELPARVISRLRAECKTDGWVMEYNAPDQREPGFGSLKLSAYSWPPVATKCRCPGAGHVRGCEGAVLRNPQ